MCTDCALTRVSYNSVGIFVLGHEALKFETEEFC